MGIDRWTCYPYLSSCVVGDLNTILMFLLKLTSAGLVAVLLDDVLLPNKLSVLANPNNSQALYNESSVYDKN